MADKQKRSGLDKGSQSVSGKKRLASSSLGPDGGDSEEQRPKHMPPPPNPHHQLSAFSPSSSRASSASPYQPRPPGRVLIPRMKREEGSAVASGRLEDLEKHRVSHACESCRIRKTKCTGENPACAHCKKHGLDCVYGDRKREKDKRDLDDLQERADEYEQLLRHLSIHGDDETRQSIEKSPSPTEDGHKSSGSAQYGEDVMSAEVGSPEHLDQTEEDINRDEERGPSGFYGKSSDVAWIRRAQKEARRGEEDDASTTSPRRDMASKIRYNTGPPATTDQGKTASEHADEPLVANGTYQLDDCELTVRDDAGELALPPRETADTYVKVYFGTIHPSYPIISKSRFLNYYNRQFDDFGEETLDRRWRAILNLVFALGSKFLDLKGALPGDVHAHMVFFSRARTLSLNDEAFWNIGEFEQIQVGSLSVLYLISANRTNRAWYLSGLVVRHAQTLGLYLRNSSRQMTAAQKEERTRVWWSIFALESHLGVICGRPSAINHQDVSHSLPIETEDDARSPLSGSLHAIIEQRRREGRDSTSSRQASVTSSTPLSASSTPSKEFAHMTPKPSLSSTARSPSSVTSPSGPQQAPTMNGATFFHHRTKINILTHYILSQLFCAEVVDCTWADIQGRIDENDLKLSRWRKGLPSELDFRNMQQNSTHLREKFDLGMLYWSAKVLVTRPCLCKIQKGGVRNESNRSKDFDHICARSCVYAAVELLNMIPDEPDPVTLYEVSSWWCVLSNLVQASSVLMMELSYQAEHVPEGTSQIHTSAAKAVKWLHAMSANSLAAARAWHLMDGLLRNVGRKTGADFSDVPEETPKLPQIWARETSIEGRSGSESMQGWQHKGTDSQALFPALTAEFAMPPLFGPETFYQPAIYSTYDHLSSYPATSPVTSVSFPTAAQMEQIGQLYQEDLGYPLYPPN
ncbi:MAG: hypothetical protein M1833_003167 [Piccolia ochrophora]|nr:MAG: hypothetical protein M1833_003167 [Piccolia ochrophora]